MPTSESSVGAKTAQTRWPVLIGSGLIIVAITLWAILAPGHANGVIVAVVTWVGASFGWYYVLTAAIIVAFVLILAFSSAGRLKLGPDHSKPQFNLFTWTSMLFAAGIGIDLMFFSTAEPVAQYTAPPTGEAETVAAARQAIVWTLFHYGIAGWAMYALLGGAFAYFAYRRNLPLSLRSLLTPLFGKRVHGWIGDTVDITAVIGTVFGIATSLGIGVLFLNSGLNLVFGIPEAPAVQIALIALSVAMATISTVSGVEKGIRRLSEANVVLAVVLLIYVTVTGQTRLLLDGLVMNVGDFVSRFPSMIMETFAWERPDTWLGLWTLFFWAWWLAWAPFVGLFLARISRGRTLREFIIGVLVAPFTFIAIFISIFGNSALDLFRSGESPDYAADPVNAPAATFWELLAQYPGAPVLVGLALITGLLFYVTSADSGALVMANFTSDIDDPRKDPANWMRVFWSVVTGLLTIAMLLAGGLYTLQYATVIVGLPLSIVIYLVMFSFYRALRGESAQRNGMASASAPRFGGVETTWRRRLKRATTFPQREQTVKYIDSVVEPALTEVGEELRANGVDVSVERSVVDGLNVPAIRLHADFGEAPEFSYQVYPIEQEMPSFALKTPTDGSRYFRLEVFTATGSRGYDVYGYEGDQIIADVLALYEEHTDYLRSTDGAPATGAISVVTDWQDDFIEPNRR